MVYRPSILISFLLLSANVYADFLVNSYSFQEPPPLYTYCVRQDGTATFANATDCTDAASSMSVSTFNASSFSSDDVVAFSSRGGNFTSVVIVPSSGTDGHPIVYKGEPGHLPDWTGGYWRITKSYVEIDDITVSTSGAASSFLFGDNTNTYTGIVTNNLKSYNVGNQSFQHLDGVTVVHSNMYAEGAGDEAVSSHNETGTDDPIITINGITIVDCVNGFNWVGAPTLNVYDFSITGVSATGKSIQCYPGVLAGSYAHFERGIIVEDPDNTAYIIDSYYGTYVFKNVMFFNLTDGNYYMLARTGTDYSVINCTFVGDGTNTTTAIFNQTSTGKYVNNIILNTLTGGFYSATNGTVDYNLFYNSGTAKGTNYVTTDPNLDANGKIQSVSSSAYLAGVGPSSDSDVPILDFENDSRSGSTTSMGADEYEQ